MTHTLIKLSVASAGHRRVVTAVDLGDMVTLDVGYLVHGQVTSEGHLKEGRSRTTKHSLLWWRSSSLCIINTNSDVYHLYSGKKLLKVKRTVRKWFCVSEEKTWQTAEWQLDDCFDKPCHLCRSCNLMVCSLTSRKKATREQLEQTRKHVDSTFWRRRTEEALGSTTSSTCFNVSWSCIASCSKHWQSTAFLWKSSWISLWTTLCSAGERPEC